MAAVAEHIQKNFKLTIKEGLPRGVVERMGAVNWLRCCPLCGSVHQILEITQDMAYTPMCQTHPHLYKAELASWQKLHPDVNAYKSVYLTIG
jgi:hypothetical protein